MLVRAELPALGVWGGFGGQKLMWGSSASIQFCLKMYAVLLSNKPLGITRCYKCLRHRYAGFKQA